MHLYFDNKKFIMLYAGYKIDICTSGKRKKFEIGNFYCWISHLVGIQNKGSERENPVSRGT